MSYDPDISDQDMPDGMVAQPGVGDLEEEFRDVTQGFDEMHERVPDPILELDGQQDYDDIQRDASEESRAVDESFDVGPPSLRLGFGDVGFGGGR